MADSILTITEEALVKIIEIRDMEPGDEPVCLFLEITGSQGLRYEYELSFVPLDDRRQDDVVESHGDLRVLMRNKDLEALNGATISMGSDPLNPGLSIDNPNEPSSPTMGGPPVGELTGEVAEKVAQVIEHEVNPAIAAHGGAARLISVEDDTVYVELLGGCQGCGMASVTLTQGIERIIRERIPEIQRVLDTTDHASGSNPYYQAAKK